MMPDQINPALTSSRTACVIAGGGPAGMMLGLLLARAGIPVTVLEKHKDFFRDFRGDTIHTSTLEILRELGLLDAFLKLPHQKAYRLGLTIGRDEIVPGDFRHLPTLCKYVAFMPQWDFLDFLKRQAQRYPEFTLRMEARADALLRAKEGSSWGRVVGVRVKAPQGHEEIHAGLVVACDGRDSELRHQSGLPVIDQGSPLDVLWFRLGKTSGDPDQLLGRIDRGHMLVMIDRGAYWQCAYLIEKDGLERLKAGGLEAFRAGLAQLAPFATDRIADSVKSWDDLKLLSIQVNHLHRWHAPGFLCIGDAAHAMSPIGGVGINLAIQDAVAAANILHGALKEGSVPDRLLEQVQARREKPTRMIQTFQLQAQDFLFRAVLKGGTSEIRAPWWLKLATRLPLVRSLLPRFIALGPRREHVEIPDVHS